MKITKTTIKILVFVLVIIAIFFVWRARTVVAPEPTPSSSIVADPLIVIYEPKPNTIISSPLKITGKARGPWYFEASFPIELTDSTGKIIARGIAQAQDDWMTENFVPFTAELIFTKPLDGNTGTLILKKDNPSGDPRFDDSRRIQIRFNP